MATILCVEDESDLREDIVEELQDSGYDVLQAGDGVEGLDMILSHKPDLVVSDITMPHLTGHELLSHLRSQHSGFEEMPFIFLSALADRKDVIEGVKLGADDYLTKPVDFEMLLAKVEAGLRQARRMIDKKEREQIKLFNALTQAASAGEKKSPWPAMKPRKIILVGESDKGLWQLQRFLEELGHQVGVFTSGRAYLNKVQDGDAVAHLTMLWFQTDDMQAPMIMQFVEEKIGRYVLVIPEKVNTAAPSMKIKGLNDVIGLPVDEEQLVGKIREWTQ